MSFSFILVLEIFLFFPLFFSGAASSCWVGFFFVSHSVRFCTTFIPSSPINFSSHFLSYYHATFYLSRIFYLVLFSLLQLYVSYVAVSLNASLFLHKHQNIAKREGWRSRKCKVTKTTLYTNSFPPPFKPNSSFFSISVSILSSVVFI